MLLRSAILAAALSVIGTNAASVVVDLLPKNFDSIVIGSGKPALVEFFAPWCGHCKTLAPIYDELAAAFEHVKDKVTIAKVDADAHKSLGSRFGVQGFPTLKWFDGESGTPVDYNGGRDLESLRAFVEEKTGIKGKGKKGAPASDVAMLTDANFGHAVGRDRNVLVAFTAPWCGHCKTLAPIWESLATTFVTEDSVVIAKVDADADNAKRTALDNGVKSYPTIKFWAAGSPTAEEYKGGRSEADFVNFLNEKTGTHRVAGGGLDLTAGTVAALDALVAKFTGKTATLEEVAAEVRAAAEGLADTKYASYYVKVLDKLAANGGYVEKEAKRLAGLVSKGSALPREKLDDLVSRSNILQRFKQVVDETVEKVKDEL